MELTIDLSPANAERPRLEAECLGLAPRDRALTRYPEPARLRMPVSWFLRA